MQTRLGRALVRRLRRATVHPREEELFPTGKRSTSGHYVREGASFFAGNAGGHRGWAAAVTLTKVAQLENRGEALRGRHRRRRRGSAARKTVEENIRVLSAISIYFASNLHVSPRVSSLFRASTFLLAPFLALGLSPSLLRRRSLFFVHLLRIIARKQTRNPLVTRAHQPSRATRIQNIPPRDNAAKFSPAKNIAETSGYI